MLFFNSLIDFTVEKFKNASLLDSGLEFSRKVFGDGLRAAILLLLVYVSLRADIEKESFPLFRFVGVHKAF
jgi:hypothetical protein